jgi:hypothetical protein
MTKPDTKVDEETGRLQLNLVYQGTRGVSFLYKVDTLSDDTLVGIVSRFKSSLSHETILSRFLRWISLALSISRLVVQAGEFELVCDVALPGEQIYILTSEYK